MTVDTGKPPPGGGGDAFSPQDAMAFMQKLWNPFGLPMPGFPAAGAGDPAGAVAGAMPGMPFPSPAAMFAALDPVEVERKINDLKVIEGWLAMSLNMMQMSIKTLELQKASLEAMRSTHAPANSRAPGKG
jgi:hypothetical protein